MIKLVIEKKKKSRRLCVLSDHQIERIASSLDEIVALLMRQRVGVLALNGHDHIARMQSIVRRRVRQDLLHGQAQSIVRAALESKAPGLTRVLPLQIDRNHRRCHVGCHLRCI